MDQDMELPFRVPASRILNVTYIFSVTVSLRSGPDGLGGSEKRFMLFTGSVAYELAYTLMGQTIERLECN